MSVKVDDTKSEKRLLGTAIEPKTRGSLIGRATADAVEIESESESALDDDDEEEEEETVSTGVSDPHTSQTFMLRFDGLGAGFEGLDWLVNCTGIKGPALRKVQTPHAQLPVPVPSTDEAGCDMAIRRRRRRRMRWG